MSMNNTDMLNFLSSSFQIVRSRIIMILSLLLILSSAARADFRVCNQTENTVQVAIGYLSDNIWKTEGWWTLRTRRCATILQGPLTARFYYFYAEDTVTGGGWIGQTLMCIKETEFTIEGVADCYAKGYDRKPFKEIDTRNLRNWTVQLTDIDRTEGL